ncbi:MAG TPA: transglutaminaseTgpA domain-containing protein [Acidimicrobiales bacterium]|nr:transglutaminaseTgpA domain-containing protein [Acidimicrobiales bacterium]
MTDEQRADLPALGALVFLDFVAALTLARLFTSSADIAPVLLAVVIGHCVAFACRWRNLSAGATGFIVVGVAVLSALWLVLPQHTFYGLPTSASFEALWNALSDARRDFGVATAPTNPTEGFTLALVMAVVALAALADWAAFRIRTTIEAAVPAFTLFIFAGVLGTARHRATATVAFTGALLVWLVTDNATVVARTKPWFQGTADAGRRAMSRAGVGLGTIGLVGALLGLALPFAQDPPAVAWRNRNQDQARTTISPLVDIRSRLVARSDVVAFTVTTPLRSYWRLTSLDVFDGDIWSSHGSYKDVDSDKNLKDRSGDVFAQTFNIMDPRSIWLPVAYRPASTPTADDISFDDKADAFITAQPTSDGLSYAVRSAVPSFTPDALRRTAPGGRIGDDQTALPTNLDPRVSALALQITQGLRTNYEKAYALQQYLRSAPFRYDLSVTPGHGNDALARFLFVTKRGYCEQFAGSFAVLARLAGLPSRVAVGFTAGERDAATGTWTVRELHAHAWPEVYLGSAGWVAFEPTPGRGIPGAESYTGAVEAQADTRRPTAASTAVPTTVSRDAAAPSANLGATTTSAPPAKAPDSSAGGRPIWRVLAMISAAVALIASLVASIPLTIAARRRRRFASAPTPLAKVIVAWTDTDEALRFAGAPVRRSHTPAERVHSVGDTIGDGGVATLTRLADVVDTAAYSAASVSEQSASQAWRDAAEVRRYALATRPRWKTILFSIDPRRLRRVR